MAENNETLISLLETTSGHLLSLIRLNVFIVAVYVSVVAITIRSGRGFEDVLNSRYTFFAVITWAGSTVLLGYTYFATTAKSFQLASITEEQVEEDNNEQEFRQPDVPAFIHDPGGIFVLQSISLLGTIISLFSFSFGYYDGFLSTGVPITRSLEIIFTGTIFIFVTGTYLLMGLVVLFYLVRKANSYANSLKDIETREIKEAARTHLTDFQNKEEE